MKQALLSLLIAVAIVGCYTQKKAIEQTQKALIKYPEVVANIARTAFPCVTTKSDTVVSTKDSVVYIECPEEEQEETPEEYIPDTVVVTKVVKSIKTVKVPVTLPVRTITVIKKVEDSAKIFALTTELQISKEYGQKADRKIYSRNTWLKWLLLVLLLSLAGNWFQLKSKFKIKK